jgi:hypothetical protein
LSREKVFDELGVLARPQDLVVGIHDLIIAVVNVRDELRVVPVIERIREEKAARGTTPVLDRHSGRRQSKTAVLLAGLVEIDGAVRRSVAAANFARRRAGKRGFGRSNHCVFPGRRCAMHSPNGERKMQILKMSGSPALARKLRLQPEAMS